jgi:EAL domain-containing protein (putative c-di-GMP-specific phosphodiesterase class I)
VLALHYQPKVGSEDGTVTGVEALLRWQHPQRGGVSPGVFIPVAERFGLIVPLIQDLESSADGRAIVKAVIELAHALSLSVVAEGVETEGQAEVLRGKRCDKLQGFLFARPMPAEALTRWARRQDDSPRFSPSAYAELQPR